MRACGMHSGRKRRREVVCEGGRMEGGGRGERNQRCQRGSCF